MNGKPMGYYGSANGTVLGPYRPDETGARARAIEHLLAEGGDPYFVEATSFEQARARLRSYLSHPSRSGRSSGA